MERNETIVTLLKEMTDDELLEAQEKLRIVIQERQDRKREAEASTPRLLRPNGQSLWTARANSKPPCVRLNPNPVFAPRTTPREERRDPIIEAFETPVDLDALDGTYR